MNKAVFLDRDGVINRKGGSYYIFKKEEFIFNPGIKEALKYFCSKDYLLIIITNQGGIARGLYTAAELEELHGMMVEELGRDGIMITGIFVCPHHPDVEPCDCRKPGTLLFEKAMVKFDIDPSSSYMIGDSEIDIIPAEKLGIKAILVPTNGNIMELIVKPGII